METCTAPFDPNAEVTLLFTPLQGQGRSLLWGKTREQGQRYFSRLQAAQAAEALRYQGGENAKTLIDRLHAAGAVPEETPDKRMQLRLPDGSVTPFRQKAEMDYIHVVWNRGKLARNY